MARLKRALLSADILLAFIFDWRANIPLLLVVVVLLSTNSADRFEAIAAATLLAASSVSFLLGSEVLAWALALAVAVLAGVSAARPTGRGRQEAAR